MANLTPTATTSSVVQQAKAEAWDSKEQESVCEYLDWDSSFFGWRIARVVPHKLDSETARSISGWCSAHQIDCLYFLADADDDRTVGVAEENNFHFVDIRVTLERPLNTALPEQNEGFASEIRPSAPEDIPALQAIARSVYKDTRFHYDTHFPVDHVEALYETWIEKSCKGYADIVFVAVVEDQVAGYVSCHLLDPTLGQIGLVGVRPDFGGIGLGHMLVNRSLRWFAEHNLARARVVTQGRNCQAQRLYERCGFLTQVLHLWYHRWFPPQGPHF